jgi:hypothetical protein
MKISDKIQSLVMGWFLGSAADILIPNFYIGRYEMDVCKIAGGSRYVTEFEIKISRSDFFADFKKSHTHWREGKTVKHDLLSNRSYVANRFFYVVPDGLITVAECPPYAGLIYHSGTGLRVVKAAKLLHRTPFTDFEGVANTLAGRERRWRHEAKWSTKNYEELSKKYHELLKQTNK